MLQLILAGVIAAAAPPVIHVDSDNLRIVESCTISVADQPITDADGNGVIHIVADGVTVDFNGSTLRGDEPGRLPDTFAGTGIRIAGQRVTLIGARVRGYKVGIHAVNADGLTIGQCDVSDNFRQRLRSTAATEESSDWLWPHANDGNEWMTNYGAGLYIEESANVEIHDVMARRTQNGIVLDGVNGSKVYDCDCSFLSGWGLAMWRSNRNVISRNAFDFCVRGYSHGVYNRGQDSAGILMFEQCSANVIAENSVTHGGDGLFGFAGKDALGEVNPRDDAAWYSRRGCNHNTIVRNDFSDAVAHGLELTFSFGNLIRDNRFHGNAICGIWGGYSQDTRIESNEFSMNGEMAYGRERGGINIEHGRGNLIRENRFSNNKCAVRLWWDDDGELLHSRWAQANGHASEDNSIIANQFNDDDVVLENVTTKRTIFDGNAISDVDAIIDSDNPADIITNNPDWRSVRATLAPLEPLNLQLPGVKHPRGLRRDLAGRSNIIMTEWGPWDHRSPLLRIDRWFSDAVEYQLLGVNRMPLIDQFQIEGDVNIGIKDRTIRVEPQLDQTLVPYSIGFEVDGHRLGVRGTVATGRWEVWTFASACDPREDIDRWRNEGHATHLTLSVPALDFHFGSGGMSEARGLPMRMPRDHFGVIATRTLTVLAGSWRINTLSDDGIRVWMNDELVIDDWTHHAATRHHADFTVDEPRLIRLRVEYFELDGASTLTVELQPRTP